MRRGLTLLETMASLALLSLIAIACSEWVAMAARMTTMGEHDAAGSIAIEALFTQIQDDLCCGEFPRDGREPAFRQNELTIPLSVGTFREQRRYRLWADGRLVLQHQEFDSETPTEWRPLLTGVRRFDGDYDPESRRLWVTIFDADGVEHRRRFRVP